MTAPNASGPDSHHPVTSDARFDSLLAAGFARNDFLLDEPLGVDSAGSAPTAAELTPSAERIGYRLPARYELQEVLARGGIGVVYKARDHKLGRTLAIKVLREKFRARESMQDRFREEAQLGAQLQHPGIVAVHEFDVTGTELPFFTMKLIQGKTLASVLQNRASLPRQTELLRIFEQVCQAIAYAHSRGVVHRDLKPSNIMVGEYGEVQVVDWGIAKVIRGPTWATSDAAAEPKANASDSDLDPSGFSDPIVTRRTTGPETAAGSVLGTPGYMAPEQAAGTEANVDARIDVFALGAILFEILTGTSPALCSAKRGNRHIEVDLADLEHCEAEESIIELATTSLAHDPSERPRDANEVAERVRDHLAAIEERTRRAELRVAEARARADADRKARRLSTILTIAVVLIVVGGGWFELNRRGLRERSERLVLSALAAADRKYEVATSGEGFDQNSWTAALQGVQSVQSLAESTGVGGALMRRLRDLSEKVRSGHRAARTRTTELARERAILDRLQNVRLELVQHWDYARTDRTYQRIFAELGIDPTDSRSRSESVTRIRELRSPHEAVALLDHWSACRRRIEREDEALVALTCAADPDPRRAKLRDLISMPVAESLSRLATAIDARVAPRSTVLLLARAWRRVGNEERSRDVVRQALQAYPGDVWLNVFAGQECLQRDPEAATRHYAAALSSQPSSPMLANNLAAAMGTAGRTREAAEILQHWLAFHPDMPILHRNLGSVLAKAGHSQEALASFETAIRLDPNQHDARESMGRLLRHLDNPAEARRCYEEVLRRNPRHLGTLLSFGALLCDVLGDFPAAESMSRKLLALDPTHSGGRRNLAVALYHQRRCKEAIAELQKLAKLDPRDLDTQELLGRYLNAQGNSRGAEAAFQVVIRHRPQAAKVQFELGVIIGNRGDNAEAIRRFRAAVRAEDDFPEAWFNLGWHLMEDPEPANRGAAASAFRNAVTHRDTFAAAWCLLGQALRGNREFEAALPALEKGHSLGHGRDDWKLDSATWIKECRAEVAALRSWREKRRK